MQEVLLRGLDAISFKVISSLGWTIEEIRELLIHVQREVKDPLFQAYMNM